MEGLMTPERLYALSTLCFEEHLFPVYLAATAPFVIVYCSDSIDYFTIGSRFRLLDKRNIC